MQRFPSLLLTAALLAAGGVRAADTSDSTSEDTAASTEENTATVDDKAFGPKLAPEGQGETSPAATPAPAATATPAAAAPAVSATPAAKIDEKAGAPKKEDKFPLSISIGLSNSASNGWLAAHDLPERRFDVGTDEPFVVDGGAYMMQPNLATSLSLSPSASIPKLTDWLPAVSLGGSFSMSIANWFPASGNGGPYDRQVRMSDFNLRMGFPGLIPKEEFTGITVSPSLSTSIPVSITSRQQNKLTSLGAGLGFGWTSPEWTWGQIGVNYSPRVGFNFYTQSASTIPCEAGVTLAGVVENPLENNELPLAYAREAEIGPNGECVLRGRQGVASINNSLSASWSLGDHSVSTSVAWGIGFLQGIRNDPALSSPNASGQNFNENMSGNVSYSYSFEKLVGFPLGVSAGVGSSGSAYRYNPDTNEFDLRFPFYDFFTPAQGYSAAFVDLSVGL